MLVVIIKACLDGIGDTHGCVRVMLSPCIFLTIGNRTCMKKRQLFITCLFSFITPTKPKILKNFKDLVNERENDLIGIWKENS